ncbi:hypothetical protein B0H16DRAFT_1476413 [Mycena metata]|uniref:Uncharacterized protein n=1 Tax=Mycena metata TaxID=1033252 RepID=A0AAD7HBE5_9AGAR|nr:hypothetical protein B0H16DRAFT_1476413 [Mycena metata]
MEGTDAILEDAAREGVKAAEGKGETAFTLKFVDTINKMRLENQNSIVWAAEPNEQQTGADLCIQWNAIHDGKIRTEIDQNAIQSKPVGRRWMEQRVWAFLYNNAWYKSAYDGESYQAVTLLNLAYGNHAKIAKLRIEAHEETTTVGFLLVDNRALFVKKEPRVWVVLIARR